MPERAPARKPNPANALSNAGAYGAMVRPFGDRAMPGFAADQTVPDNALPARRRSELVRLVRARGQITVADIAVLFDVSADTIRRDLDFLADQGLLKRTHGGALASDSLVGADTPFALRINTRKEAKARIARAAARLIADRETLLVNGGSTTLAFAAELGGRSGLTVVTNNLGLPGALPRQAVRDVYMLGGLARLEAQVTLGAVGFAGTGSISADTAVIGVGGISRAGIFTSMLAEAEMIAAMLAACHRVIVLADASKFHRPAFAQIAPLGRVHVLVTDAEPPEDLGLAEAGVDVICAGA
jgi:DeoR/GlpR family transcriptional regulator of sugar metabolism